MARQTTGQDEGPGAEAAPGPPESAIADVSGSRHPPAVTEVGIAALSLPSRFDLTAIDTTSPACGASVSRQPEVPHNLDDFDPAECGPSFRTPPPADPALIEQAPVHTVPSWTTAFLVHYLSIQGVHGGHRGGIPA